MDHNGPARNSTVGAISPEFDILVVDDQRSCREVLGMLLLDCGIRRVRLAENGIQALSEVCRRHPDCIFMDLLMPGMDGLMTATIIRHYEASQSHRAYIVGLSSNIERMLEYCVEAGMDDCLTKSLNGDDLRKIFSTQDQSGF